MQHHRPQPHLVAPSDEAADADGLIKRRKKRGSYNCGRCGHPKKGHSCHAGSPSCSPSSLPAPSSTPAPTAASSTAAALPSSSISSATRAPAPRHPISHLRRALSFDDFEVRSGGVEDDDEDGVESDRDEEVGSDVGGGLTLSCLWEVLRRLMPAELSSAAQVCKGWRETSRRLWRAVEKLRLRVPATAQFGFFGSVLQKSPGLVRLSLRLERSGIFLGMAVWAQI